MFLPTKICYFTLVVKEARDISGHGQLRMFVPAIHFERRTNNDLNQQTINLSDQTGIRVSTGEKMKT